MRLGKVSENVLKRSVWREINRNSKTGAAGYSDCAFFDVYEQDGCGIRTLQASGISTLSHKHPARYSLISAANNIYASGGIPDMAELTVLLPPDAEESMLKALIREASEVSDELGFAIRGGHTEVTALVKEPLVTATVTGRQELGRSEREAAPKGSRAELEIYISKWIGLGGTAILAEEREEEILRRYPPFIEEAGLGFGTVNYLSVRDEAAIAAKMGAIRMHDVSGGGVFAALWELGEMLGMGFDIDLKRIPVRQETVEITDLFGINPYQMFGQGALLIAIPAGSGLMQALEDAGIPASFVGKAHHGNDRIIRNGDEVRFMDLPQADSLLA